MPSAARVKCTAKFWETPRHFGAMEQACRGWAAGRNARTATNGQRRRTLE